MELCLLCAGGKGKAEDGAKIAQMAGTTDHFFLARPHVYKQLNAWVIAIPNKLDYSQHCCCDEKWEDIE